MTFPAIRRSGESVSHLWNVFVEDLLCGSWLTSQVADRVLGATIRDRPESRAMTLKIERVVQPGLMILKLSGRIDGEYLEELGGLLEHADGHDKIIDLEEIRLADRDAIKFLAACEITGIQLLNCPAYIRNWIEIEKGQP